jgi:hypothetical protein
MTISYKMVNITLRTPGMIQGVLDQEGPSGWEAHGTGSSYLVLGRADDQPREHMMAGVMLQSTGNILKRMTTLQQDGWLLATLGTNFAFFRRIKGEDTSAVEYRVESIAMKTPGAITALIDMVGQEGWALRGLGANAAFFLRKPQESTPMRHVLTGVLLRTPARIQQELDLRAGRGYRLASVTRSFMAFVGPADDVFQSTS